MTPEEAKTAEDRVKLREAGWREAEVAWEIVRGAHWDHVITDVRISADGKYVWFKTGPKK